MESKEETKLIDTEKRLVIVRGREMGGQNGKGDQKVRTSSYKTNKSWGCNVQHGDHKWKNI